MKLLKLKKVKLLVLTMMFMLIAGFTFTGSTSTQAKAKKVTYLGKYKLTAYCGCRSCSGGWGNRTASGKKAKAGRTIAVDKRKIKLGTKVKIKGKTYVAEDVGGGVKGKHIDIYFTSHKKVKKFGRKNNIKVYKIKK
ncbi:MAG: 3D domain-containing protein [Anaerostipes sp.]|jgi:3D (Asp-Asp-Asp) domain-containing protein|nr:3D domain-containing protein [Anaerostipes sp.]MDD3746259.1 3D domain-containing protein [Anaerostipes sp.]MDD4371334.1 3D domain-containing protein [Anaerostipes sp.]